MKKLLSVLAAVGLTATASSAVVACGSSKEDVKTVNWEVANDATGFEGSNSKGESFDQVLDNANDYYSVNNKIAADVEAANNVTLADAKKDSTKIKQGTDDQVKGALIAIYSDGTNMSIVPDAIFAKHADKKAYTITVRMTTIGDLVDLANKDKKDSGKVKASDFLSIQYQAANKDKGLDEKFYLIFNQDGTEKSPLNFFTADKFNKDNLKDLFDKGTKEAKVNVTFAAEAPKATLKIS